MKQAEPCQNKKNIWSLKWLVKLASDNDLISIEKQAEPCQNNYMMTMRDKCVITYK